MIQAAQALREVRRAHVNFLLNWTRDQAAEAEQVLPRLTELGLSPEADKRDWTHLYDGSVLDD